MMNVGWCDVLFTGVLFCDVHKFTQGFNVKSFLVCWF